MVPRRPCLQNVLFPGGVLLSVGVEPEDEVTMSTRNDQTERERVEGKQSAGG